jgi:hypothetical protein
MNIPRAWFMHHGPIVQVCADEQRRLGPTMARSNTKSPAARCFPGAVWFVTRLHDRIGNLRDLVVSRLRTVRFLSAVYFACLFACLFAGPAGARVVDLEEMKRLARIDTSTQVQQEAAEKARQAAADKADQPANRQGAAPSPKVLSGMASQMDKLARGIEAAHAAAPNKWYQAAKVEDITPPGDDARKVYQITGVLGTYCLRYPDKNKADQGRAYVGEPLLGACPHMF